jgi:hypothetical protein
LILRALSHYLNVFEIELLYFVVQIEILIIEIREVEEVD